MQDYQYWIAATYLPNLGPIRINRLLEMFGNIKNLFSATFDELKSMGLNTAQIAAIRKPFWKQVDADIAWAQNNNAHILIQANSQYPALLKQISAAPLVLYVQGDLDLLSFPQLAMVGSRNPTATGKETATEFARALSEAGLVITSGMALGVDAACHKGALAANNPTIAVVGAGLNTIYPAAHHLLAKRIRETGALVSEFSPFMPPKAQNFPLRNRIISGLSLGVLVVEAALKSGSLITSRYALEQNREVFAIPGSIHNPLARGCHHLIQQGAKLVETAADILEELQIVQQVKQSEGFPELPAFLNFIGWEPTSLDTIILRSGLTPAEVSSMLLLLELEGYVQAGSGGYTRLT